MSGYNNDDVIYEAVEPNKGHDSDTVSNVIYSGMSRKEAKRQQSNLDKFHQWTASLGGNRDVRTETHQFNVRMHTVDYNRKGEPIKAARTNNNSPLLQESEMKKHHYPPYYSNDPQVERFYKAKQEAGLI